MQPWRTISYSPDQNQRRVDQIKDLWHSANQKNARLWYQHNDRGHSSWPGGCLHKRNISLSFSISCLDSREFHCKTELCNKSLLFFAENFFFHLFMSSLNCIVTPMRPPARHPWAMSLIKSASESWALLFCYINHIHAKYLRVCWSRFPWSVVKQSLPDECKFYIRILAIQNRLQNSFHWLRNKVKLFTNITELIGIRILLMYGYRFDINLH